MTPNDPDFLEQLCNRFILAQEATGLSRVAFGKRVGLSGSQMTNISRYRNPPSHEALRNACREFGFTANWFYEGSPAGLLDANHRGAEAAGELALNTVPIPANP